MREVYSERKKRVPSTTVPILLIHFKCIPTHIAMKINAKAIVNRLANRQSVVVDIILLIAS